ncbi:MAG: hypothetical protein KME10_15550 [Plectolyngbya sp. WJT66-NPBG17]|nr:hypothetical protein [Plectolyngbya sp. WJT66-NPBG17]MBW4524391.1 hypothetical protein [Phormidium tanganyikae FI6-MK23]
MLKFPARPVPLLLAVMMARSRKSKRCVLMVIESASELPSRAEIRLGSCSV